MNNQDMIKERDSGQLRENVKRSLGLKFKPSVFMCIKSDCNHSEKSFTAMQHHIYTDHGEVIQESTYNYVKGYKK